MSQANQATEREALDAFEAKYQSDSRDPAMSEELRHFMNGWQARASMQQAVVIQPDTAQQVAEPSRIERAAKAVLKHWCEFGHEHGFDEAMAHLDMALSAPQHQEGG